MAILESCKITILVVILATLHNVHSGCNWHHASPKDSEEDIIEQRSNEVEEDKDDDGWRPLNTGRFVGGSSFEDEDDFDDYDEFDNSDEDKYLGISENEDIKKRKESPTETCHKQGGYCMRSTQERCKGEIRLFQTNCIDECECCKADKEVTGHKGHVEIIRSRRDWQGARDECRDLGGDLLVPESIGELLYYLRKNDMSTHKVWIGINDHSKPGKFRGIQGNHIKNGWQNGEPRNHLRGEDCVVIQDRRDSKRGMRVRRCREEHYFICDLGDNYRSDHHVRY